MSVVSETEIFPIFFRKLESSFEKFFQETTITGTTKIFLRVHDGLDERAYERKYKAEALKCVNVLERILITDFLDELEPVDCEEAEKISVQIFTRMPHYSLNKYVWLGMRLNRKHCWCSGESSYSLTSLKRKVDCIQRAGDWDPVAYL